MLPRCKRVGSLALGWAGVPSCSAFVPGKAWEMGPQLGGLDVAPGLIGLKRGQEARAS